MDVNTLLTTGLKESGLDLGLHNDEELRLQASEKAPNCVMEIKGKEEMFNLWKLFLGILVTADGCGG